MVEFEESTHILIIVRQELLKRQAQTLITLTYAFGKTDFAVVSFLLRVEIVLDMDLFLQNLANLHQKNWSFADD